MQEIGIEHNPTTSRLNQLGAMSWPISEKEVLEFPWHYDEKEVCYFLEADVTVTPEGGEPVRFGKGDLVMFPAGMSCTWKIHEGVRKHYKFG